MERHGVLLRALVSATNGKNGAAALRKDFSFGESRYDRNPPDRSFAEHRHRARAAASSALTSGRRRISEIPALASASTSTSVVDAVASRIGRFARILWSARARSKPLRAGDALPTTTASNRSGAARHAATASSGSAKPTGSYPSAA